MLVTQKLRESETGSSDDDYNVKELKDSRIVSKVNDVAETLSIDNSSDSEIIQAIHIHLMLMRMETVKMLVSTSVNNLCIFHCFNCSAILSCKVCCLYVVLEK